MQNFTIKFSNKAEKQLRKLHPKIIDKLHKQLELLMRDVSHPSLGLKKVKGKDLYEVRIDYHNRFTCTIGRDSILIHTLGPHDEGLGKK